MRVGLGVRAPSGVLDAETVQQRIPVRARANGTFPLTVSIMTPQGDVTIATPTELTVQATILSGFGVVLSLVAGLVMLYQVGKSLS